MTETYRYALPWLLWCVICLAFSLSRGEGLEI